MVTSSIYVTFDTCGSKYDTYLYLYNNTGYKINEINSNDDSNDIINNLY